MSDSVDNFYTLNTGRYDSSIGDQTDVVAEASTTCDSTNSQDWVTIYDVGQPHEDWCASCECTPGSTGCYGQQAAADEANASYGLRCDTQRQCNVNDCSAYTVGHECFCHCISKHQDKQSYQNVANALHFGI